MNKRGNLVLGKEKNKKAAAEEALILHESYENGDGQTVYRAYDNGDGTKTVAIAFLGKDPHLAQGSQVLNSFDNSAEAAEIQRVANGNPLYGKLGNSNLVPSKVPCDEFEQVKAAYHMYHSYFSGIIRTYVDFMTDVAVDGLKNVPSKKYKDKAPIYKQFYDVLLMDQNKLQQKIRDILFDLFCCNNAYVWTTLAPYTTKYFESLEEVPVDKITDTKKGGKRRAIATLKSASGEYAVKVRATGEYLEGFALEEYAAKKKRWSNRQIPNVITTLCPATVQIHGGKLFGTKEYHVTLDTDTVKYIKEHADKISEFVNPEIIKTLRTDDGINLVFNDKEITHLAVKPDYLKYGQPKILAALEPIIARMKKESVDQKAADKLIRQIVLVTMGDEKYPATLPQLKAAASVFKSMGQVGTIFWNHTMKVQFLGPSDLAQMLSNSNYEHIDNIIFESLDFPMFLSGRESKTSFAMATYVLRPIKHMIQTHRQVVMDQFLLPLYRNIADSMGFPRDAVVPVFNSDILEDPNMLAKRLTGYVQAKMTSLESTVSRLPDNFDWQNEEPLMQEEFKKGVKKGVYGVFKPTGGEGGRPSGSKGTKAPKSKTSPKGDGNRPHQKRKASVEEMTTEDILDFIYSSQKSPSEQKDERHASQSTESTEPSGTPNDQVD